MRLDEAYLILQTLICMAVESDCTDSHKHMPIPYSLGTFESDFPALHKIEKYIGEENS